MIPNFIKKSQLCQNPFPSIYYMIWPICSLIVCLDPHCASAFSYLLVFLFFSFFQVATFDYSSMNSARVRCSRVRCSRVPQTSLFNHFFIKNGLHGTIHIFKNYFATVFSVDRKSTRLNSSHRIASRMPSSA